MSRQDGSVSGRGPSIIEMLWARLDEEYADLMGDKKDLKRQGVCLGLATALAYMRNPYNPDVDAIRAEAAGRYR